MKKIIISFALGAGVLAGCNSLNNSFNTYTVNPANDQKNGKDTTDTTPPITAAVENDKCVGFVFPTLPRPPELPYAAMLAAGDDVAALEKIERRHIEELRLYILTQRKTMEKSRLQYIELCGSRALSK